MARRGTTVKTAWIVAIGASLFAIAIGPLTQQFLTPMQSEPIHYVATYLMLGAVVFLMVVLVFDRRAIAQRANVHVTGNLLTIMPCEEHQVLRLDQEGLESILLSGFSAKSPRSLHGYQVVDLSNLKLPANIGELWSHLPQMRVLNISQASLPPQFWQGLEKCSELDYVLAHQVTDSAVPKEIYMSIPEIRVYSEKMTLLLQS